LIRTGPDNTGDPVTTFTMTTDDSRTFWAAGYDADGNYRDDEVITDWSSSGDLGLSGTNLASILFEPTVPVSGTLTADADGIASYETGTITVSGGGVHHIVIRDAPDGGGNIVTTHTMTADDSLVLYAAGYDEGDTFVENTLVNWSVTGTLDGTLLSDTVYIFNPILAPRLGTIVAQIGTIQDATGDITVDQGALSSLLIRTASNNGGDQVITYSMTTDESRTFWAAGYDAEGNYRDDEVITDWSSSGDLGLSGTNSASILFEPATPRSGTLTADADGIASYETDTITVTGGVVDHIIIRDDPQGGGNIVTTHTMTTDDSLVLYSAGYDEGDNFIGNIQVNWTLTGGLDGTPISDTVFVFSPSLAPRSGTINAQIGNIQDATGTIDVGTGLLASLIIRDEPNNGGGSVTTFIMSAGDSRTFYAAGYDADGNYRDDESAAEWTSTFGLSGSGSSFLFLPTLPDTGTVTVTIGTIEYTTGDIFVTGGTLAYLLIRDGAEGGGNDLTGALMNLSADSSVILYAAGYDASDNYIGDQNVDWLSSGSLDYINVANQSNYTFSPENAPASGTITITNGTFGSSTGTITISVGALNYISINNQAGEDGVEIDELTITAGQSETLYASGYDSDGNYRDAVEVDWSSTGGLDSVGGTGTSVVFSPVTAPSTGTIVADTGGVFTDATGLITVDEGDLNYIMIRTEAGDGGVVYFDTSLTADESITLHAAGYDGENNFLFDVDVSWSSTGTLDDIVFTGTTYTFNPATAPTSGTIVATSGIYSDQTGTIDVSVGTLDYISINSSAGADGVPVDALTISADDTYTFYAASYDADNNYIAMVPAVWNETGLLDDVSGTGTSYAFDPVTAPTSGTITAIFSGETDATGTITVIPGDLDYMQINDGPGAGASEIDDITTNVGVDLVLYAAGYDQHGNFRSQESSIWTSTGSLDDVSSRSESYTFTPMTAYTSGTIIATSESDGSVSDTTGTITVDEGVLTWIQIRTAPDGEGTEFGDYGLTVDGSITLYAAGYDGGDNFIENIIVNWSSTPTLETISATDTSYEFSPTVAPTEGTIRITSGSLTDETGTITVSPGAPETVTDFDGMSGERTTVAGSTQLLRVLVEDQYGNPVNGITVNFSPDDFMSVSSDITDSDGLAESVYTTPIDADSSIIQASVSGLSPYNFTIYGIKYVSASLDPAVAQRGGTPSFTLQVSNPGNSTVPLNTALSNFSFDGGSYTYFAVLASPASLPPNSPATTLTFTPTLIDDNFPGGSYTGRIQLRGSGSVYSGMNGIISTDLGELTIGDQDITIGSVSLEGPEGPTNQILQGEQNVIASVIVTNVGNALEIDFYPETRIEFRRNDNGQIQSVLNLERTDGLLFLQSGGVQNELEFQFDLPPEYQTGLIDIFVILSLDEGTLVKAPEEPSGSFTVLQAGNANYVEGSLDPDVVVPRESVDFHASFENTGSANIVLSSATSTIEILGTGIGPSNLISQYTLGGNDTEELIFQPMTIPDGLSTGTYDVQWHLNGTLGSNEYDSVGVITDGLTIISAADLSFTSINIVPERVKQGQTGIEIIYTIYNDGESEANVTALDHQFNFGAGGEVPPNQWIPTQIEPAFPVEIAPGTNVNITATYALSATASIGPVYPNPTVIYHDVRTPTIPYNSNIINANDTVEVVQPASIKIVQLQALAPNVPNVNEEQLFNLEVTLENTGADQIQTAWVSIYRNTDVESFRDQLILTDIAPAGQKSISFEHSEPTHALYFYKAYIDSAIDAIGDLVVINQSDDKDELVNVQQPSRLEIDASIVSNSTAYDSLVVSEDQIFLVQANITNFGQSSFNPKNGRLVLQLPSSNFTFVNGLSDSLQIFTAEDTLAEWEVQASGISPGGIYEELAFYLVSVPVDTNTGDPVSEISIIDSVVHIKSEEKGRIVRNQFAILSPQGATDGILSTRQEFVVEADIVFNSTIALEGRTATIGYSGRYTLKSGQLKDIDLSTGAPAQWTIIALDHDQTGDTVFVTASGYDKNSGLPVAENSNTIQLSVVDRTDLSMTLQILKAGGSSEDTLSVGQQFTLQALINNEGTARAIGEGKVYIEGIEDNDAVIFSNLPQEDTLDFSIGEPVSWDLEIVQLPDGQSGIQSELFQLMEELDKENAITAAKSKNKITTSVRARELFNQISELTMALVTLEMNLTVKMSHIPEDENTNQTAYTQDSTVTKTTYIQPVAEIYIQRIESPATVSTNQEFSFVVTGNLINNLIEPKAHLSIPPSFENDNGSVLELLLDVSDQANFTIQVPSTANYFGAVRETLNVYLSGKDRNTGNYVQPSTTARWILTVQLKPEIYMGMEIISPIAARESGSLSHGQSITVEVWPSLVSSDKEIDYAPIDQDGSIELDDEIFSVYNYEREAGEDYKKTFTQLDQRLSFTLRAPRDDRTTLLNFKFVDLPVDNNSRNPVDVNGDSGSVSLPISVIEKKITVIMQKEYEKTTFTRGEGEHLMMAFDISNAGYQDPLIVHGLGIKFIARTDTSSLTNNAVLNIFEKIFIMDYDDYSAGSEKILNMTSYVEFEIDENTVSNPLQITFNDDGYLNGSESKKLAVVAMFRSGESSRSFRTILTNVDAYDDSPDHLVSIIDGEGRPIESSPDMQSDVFSIISTDQEQTFGNFPNPFGRSPNETTEIRFVLNSTSDVTLRIFSLAGELVKSGWNRNLTSLPGGEIYYLVWDGKNDQGDTVLNGVYICVIEIRSSSGTKTYTTKIAYIK